jgi:nucleoside-diphosphate-sugar epimerase
VTILVTGATGRIGSRFVPRVLRQGEAVRVLVRDPGKAAALEQLGAEVVAGDLRDADSVDKAVAGTEAVVHLGAVFRGASAEEMTAVNRDATAELARAGLRAGVDWFVYASTTMVYGPGKGRPALETDEPAPAGGRAYPASKAAGEKALLDLHVSEGLPLRIARLTFVYGDGDPHLAESLNWARNWPLHQRLHLVHHADVGQALHRLALGGGVDGGIYNIGDDAPVTALELLNLNGEVGVGRRHHQVPQRAGSAAALPECLHREGRRRVVTRSGAFPPSGKAPGPGENGVHR